MKTLSAYSYIILVSLFALTGCGTSDNWEALDYTQPGDAYDISQLYMRTDLMRPVANCGPEGC